MLTTRPDYEDITALLASLGKDEPVFILRARDPAFQSALQAWINRAGALGADDSILDRARQARRDADAWQQANGTKVPDLPYSLLTQEEKAEAYRKQRRDWQADPENELPQGDTVGRSVLGSTGR